ncbi:MAG TPA: Maf family protein [Candidatus Limnocylindria bacterium]|nr:Maf family protein [Candidatus Limnocylindria bacterium]
MPRLILASASPRRRELLARLRADFTVTPSDVDETLDPGPLPEATAGLALRKARAVAAGLREGVVLGADTLVVIDGEALGKPRDGQDAAAMLRRLRGRWHEVITAVAAVDAATGREAAEAVITRVQMRAYTDAEIAAYVATAEPLDKAGAYAVQERGGALVAGIEGSYSNVVGLPVDETRRLLEAFGVLTSERA